MKIFFVIKSLVVCAIVTASTFSMSSCVNKAKEIASCEGYIGAVSGKQAETLRSRNHFMQSDSIEAWNKRYLENKDSVVNNKLVFQERVYGDVSSFNNCMVRSIISNDSCIGLRVLYGMDTAFKVHIMLVGIKPDYTTLYIDRPKACDVDIASQSKDTLGIGKGGAEYAQEP